VDTSRELKVYSPLRTGFCAPATVDALAGSEGDLHPRILSLRVLTEETPQGTSLEEGHTADTRAIFETVPLDINNEGKAIHVDDFIAKILAFMSSFAMGLDQYLTARFARDAKIAEKVIFPFLLRGQKRKSSDASHWLFQSVKPCLKGMVIFLCRRLSGKEKEKPSLRPLCLCGEKFFIPICITVQNTSTV
jgi:hypothetical protein